MTDDHDIHNRVKAHRLDRAWSQEELAQRAGISRTAISAIEVGRVVPSVAAAMALAEVLGCTVEELFGVGSKPAPSPPEWAWPPGREPCRFWQAEVGGRIWRYPAEPGPLGVLAHDGVAREGGTSPADVTTSPGQTLVMAGCDPAAALLAHDYARDSGFRLLVLPRSSGQALAMLAQGRVHVAGVHLSTADGNDDANTSAARGLADEPMCLLRLARWEAGLALAPGVSARTVSAVLQTSRLSWIGREPGSGARQCLDQLRPNQPSPRRLAHDHRGVAEAIRQGWAEVGVCLRLTSEEAGLRFLGVRVENYDLCFPKRAEADPRIQALIRVIRSPRYRRLIGDLPGYDTAESGDLASVSAR